MTAFFQELNEAEMPSNGGSRGKYTDPSLLLPHISCYGSPTLSQGHILVDVRKEGPVGREEG
jgi:hypothetical protein